MAATFQQSDWRAARLRPARQRILVALDGSPFAERVLPYVEVLAARSAAQVVLLRSTSPVGIPLAAPGDGYIAWGATFDPVVLIDAEDKAAAGYLENLGYRLRAEGIETETVLVPGTAADVIHDGADAVDMIAMTTHGRGGMERAVFGSVADEVLRRAQVPVFLVPQRSTQDWGSGGPRTILVPLDDSEIARAALAPAAELARRFGSRLLLVRALDSLPPGTRTFAPDVAQQQHAHDGDAVSAWLEEIAAGLRATVDDVALRMVNGPPAEAIVRVAEEEAAGLIAMATHGRGGLARLVLGSVATEVVQHATTPLLLVGPMVEWPHAPGADLPSKARLSVPGG